MKRYLLVVVVAVLAAAGALFVPQLRDGGRDVTNALGRSGESVGSSGGGGAVPEDVQAGGLSAGLSRAMAKAQDAAARVGIELTVTSGWRSAERQQQLYEEAIQKYGSAEVARQWVLPPGESAHVRGEAVDVGPPAGASWLERNGERYGICRVYENEPWHFELLAPALGQQCPALLPHA